VYGALKVMPSSSGFCLGSSNWIITSDHEKIVYLSGSSTLTTHPRPMDHHSIKNADVLIMTDLTQTPISNPDSMLGVLCVVVGLTLRGGGNVLIPCYPTGVVYDLFECLSVKMQDLGVSNCPMFFISPVADTSLAYSNILAEWLSSVKQNKVYVTEEPFPHGLLVKNNKLKHFKHIYSDGFSTDFQEVCSRRGCSTAIKIFIFSLVWSFVVIPVSGSAMWSNLSSSGAIIRGTASFLQVIVKTSTTSALYPLDISNTNCKDNVFLNQYFFHL
jgi:Cft2 family RNA processing exonuclease